MGSTVRMSTAVAPAITGHRKASTFFSTGS